MGDPSMEDILASIRRILSEDEAPAADGTAAGSRTPAGEDVLVLDPAMMVPEPASPERLRRLPCRDTCLLPNRRRGPATSPPNLVAPEAAAAAASSVGSLVRTLAGAHHAGSQRRSDHRGHRARGDAAAAEGVAGRQPAAAGRAPGSHRDRARRRPRRTLSRIVIAGLLRHPRGAAGERNAGQDLQPVGDRAPPV